MVLVGVHPSLMQVPPTCTRSTMAVFHPALAKAVESGPPAWPAPMTMASYCVVWVINTHLSDWATRAGTEPPPNKCQVKQQVGGFSRGGGDPDLGSGLSPPPPPPSSNTSPTPI